MASPRAGRASGCGAGAALRAGAPDQPALVGAGQGANGQYPIATDTIEIVLPDGSRVRVGSGVNLNALRRVVTALRG